MNRRLQRAQQLLRRSGLLERADRVRFVWSRLRTSWDNARFSREYPSFSLPPPRLAFGAYSAPAWRFYKESGEDTARFIAATLHRHLDEVRTGAVLEWGCGPARVVRHLPPLLGSSTRVCGSDYDPDTVEWCREHIEGVEFVLNDLLPPLSLDTDSFDCAYSISVLTHLSRESGQAWSRELARVVRPGGLVIVSTCGASRLPYLLPEERHAFEVDGIVVRGDVREGGKMFGAFHHPRFVREHLLGGLDILEHAPAGFPHLDQDLWVARRPPAAGSAAKPTGNPSPPISPLQTL